MSRADRIEEAAAAWLVRQDSSSWNAESAAALEVWLDESTEHEVAFVRLEHGWRAADRLSALRAPSLSEVRPSKRWQGLSIAASIVILLFSGLFFTGGIGRIFGADAYVTEVGGRSTIPLADGSRVELNTDSAVHTEIEGRKRIVWLDRGEAYFEVAHDPARPFVVLAGDRRITVLGTKFSVRRVDGTVEVNVVEGRVRVTDLDGSAPGVLRILTRGETAVSKGPSEIVAERAPEHVAGALSWRQGMVSFDQDRLEDVIAEFNRYNVRKLSIEGSELAGMSISGRFEANNIDAFVRLLHRAYGLGIDEKEDRIIIAE